MPAGNSSADFAPDERDAQACDLSFNTEPTVRRAPQYLREARRHARALSIDAPGVSLLATFPGAARGAACNKP